MNVTSQIARSLVEVKEQILSAEKRADKEAGSVELIAISKTHPVTTIESALNIGHRCFGENRVQEAQKKWPGLLEKYDGIKLHLVGALQSNKVRQALKLFHAIQSLDRVSLAGTLAKQMDVTGCRPDCYIQVNTGAERQKAGVLPDQADSFIDSCINEFGLPVKGLMCIPPLEDEPSPHFVFLGQIAERNGLGQLSMGMSGDYELAVEFGATHVRVGSAIFGQRQMP